MDVERILVTTATKMGSTAEIGDAIAERLRRVGLPVDTAPAGEVRSLAPYRAVVLGSATYMTRWRREAGAFLRRFRRQLAGRDVWLFQSGPLDHSAEETSYRCPSGSRRGSASCASGGTRRSAAGSTPSGRRGSSCPRWSSGAWDRTSGTSTRSTRGPTRSPTSFVHRRRSADRRRTREVRDEETARERRGRRGAPVDLAAPAAAATAAEEDVVVLSGTAVVAEDETTSDVVVFHGEALIEGTVTGNLVVFDGPATISGTVEGDAIAFNGLLRVEPFAVVGGDVFADERDIALAATVDGDVRGISDLGW